MLIKDLPKEIQELVHKEQRNQKKPIGAWAGSMDIYQSYVLNWSATTDGREFWKAINAGCFSIFYEKYPKPKSENEVLKDLEEEVFNFLKS